MSQSRVLSIRPGNALRPADRIYRLSLVNQRAPPDSGKRERPRVNAGCGGLPQCQRPNAYRGGNCDEQRDDKDRQFGAVKSRDGPARIERFVPRPIRPLEHSRTGPRSSPKCCEKHGKQCVFQGVMREWQHARLVTGTVKEHHSPGNTENMERLRGWQDLALQAQSADAQVAAQIQTQKAGGEEMKKRPPAAAA